MVGLLETTHTAASNLRTVSSVLRVALRRHLPSWGLPGSQRSSDEFAVVAAAVAAATTPPGAGL